MYCKNCGKQIDDDSRFCEYCGANQALPIEQPEIVSREQSAETLSATNVSAGKNGTVSALIGSLGNKKMKTYLMVAGVFIVLLIAVMFGSNLFGGEKKFSEFSEQKQEKLIDDLNKRLEKSVYRGLKGGALMMYLISIQDDEKEGQAIIECRDKWINDHKLDRKDLEESGSLEKIRKGIEVHCYKLINE